MNIQLGRLDEIVLPDNKLLAEEGRMLRRSTVWRLVVATG